MMPYTLAFAFASLVISTSSVADSFASASIGPLVIQLVDLDLNDNVTPTVAFGNPAFGAAESYVISFAAMGNDFRRNTDASAVPFLPMSTTAMFGAIHPS